MLTSDSDWEHTVWGKGQGSKLCSYQISCGDVLYAEVGNYTLQVNDSDMTWKLVKNDPTPVNECKAPKVMKDGVCVDPAPSCKEGEVLVNGSCQPMLLRPTPAGPAASLSLLILRDAPALPASSAPRSPRPSAAALPKAHSSRAPMPPILTDRSARTRPSPPTTTGPRT